MATTRFTGSLSEGSMIELDAEGEKVLLCRAEGNLFAVSAICSHGNVPLMFGQLESTTVTCPLHGAQFDLKTGRCLTGPSKLDLRSYTVRSESDGIIVTDKE